MMEEPPLVEVVADEVTDPTRVPAETEPHLPMQTLDDGTVLIDLKPLGSPPKVCRHQDPDPLNPEIIVCAQTETSPRLGAYYGPSEEAEFGSAIPRARLKITESAEAQANAINKGVGGWNANGGEVRMKIEF